VRRFPGGQARYLLRGGAAGRDPPIATRGEFARLRVHARRPDRAAADFPSSNMPKFKAHPWTHGDVRPARTTIGIQDDRHRPDRSRSSAQRKGSPNLQYIIQPQIPGHRRHQPPAKGAMLTPSPFPLKAGDHGQTTRSRSTRFCCAIIGGRSAHRRATFAFRRRRGFRADRISTRFASAATLTAGGRPRSVAKRGSRSGLVRVEKYFEGHRHHRLRRAAARRRGKTDYCWGGCCPGAIEEGGRGSCACFDKTCDARMKAHGTSCSAAYSRPHRRQAGGRERCCSSATCANWGRAALGRQGWCRSRAPTKIRGTKDPQSRQGQRHLRQDDVGQFRALQATRNKDP